MMIDSALAQRLIAAQFPHWQELPIRPVPQSGWDNRSFRLGETLLIRLPSAESYAPQVVKEQYWLPKLAAGLPVKIPVPIAMGKPTAEYPWPWSVYEWLEGESAATAVIIDPVVLAKELAVFLQALHRLDTRNGPLASAENFYRGGSLAVYDAQTRQALAVLKTKIDVQAATAIWERGLASQWQPAPVWVHGDIALGNLLIREGRLSAAIDFGQLAIGDPACDLAIAWSYFQGESRVAFQKALGLDQDTWHRARAWALWKALMVAAGLTQSNAVEAERCWEILAQII